MGTSSSRPRRPRIDAFDAVMQYQHHGFDSSRHQRARSLEHILDGGSGVVGGSSRIGPNYWVATGATLVTSKRQRNSRAPSVENMLDESSLETNSTSIPSYCTVDRRAASRQRTSNTNNNRPTSYLSRQKRGLPISSDESSDGRPASAVPPRRIYKVNSFQRPQQLNNTAAVSQSSTLLEIELNWQFSFRAWNCCWMTSQD